MVMPIHTTMFVPISGRYACWSKLSAFLDNQLIERATTKLCLLDTSNDYEFSRTVERWTLQADYAQCHHVRHVFHPEARLADKPRGQHFNDVNNVMVEIYRYAQTVAEGHTLFVVEDDVIPPVDAFVKLDAHLHRYCDVFSVSGAYLIRGQSAWTAWYDTSGEILTPGDGVEPVRATGLGCVVMDAGVFRDFPIRWTPQGRGRRKWPWGYDMEFFTDINKAGLATLINWDVRCDHLDKHGVPWQPVPTSDTGPPRTPEEALLDQ